MQLHVKLVVAEGGAWLTKMSFRGAVQPVSEYLFTAHVLKKSLKFFLRGPKFLFCHPSIIVSGIQTTPQAKTLIPCYAPMHRACRFNAVLADFNTGNRMKFIKHFSLHIFCLHAVIHRLLLFVLGPVLNVHGIAL